MKLKPLVTAGGDGDGTAQNEVMGLRSVDMGACNPTDVACHQNTSRCHPLCLSDMTWTVRTMCLRFCLFLANEEVQSLVFLNSRDTALCLLHLAMHPFNGRVNPFAGVPSFYVATRLAEHSEDDLEFCLLKRLIDCTGAVTQPTRIARFRASYQRSVFLLRQPAR